MANHANRTVATWRNSHAVIPNWEVASLGGERQIQMKQVGQTAWLELLVMTSRIRICHVASEVV